MPEAHPHNQLPKLIKAKRLKLGLSLYQMAKEAGISHSSILRIENGEVAQPTPGALTAIAKVLRLPLADMFVAAGYNVPEQLPSMKPYFRTRYSNLPAGAIRDIERYTEALAKKHGVNLNGPLPGEDE